MHTWSGWTCVSLQMSTAARVLQDSLVACEFLLQNGADVNQRDRRGRGPLHHATHLGHTG